MVAHCRTASAVRVVVDGRRSDSTLVQKIDATNSNNSYARKALHAALAAKPAGMVETMKK
jgi:hypothetical protein